MSKKIPEIVKKIKNFLPQYEENVRHISFSQFQLYNICPFQWYLTYVSKLIPYSPSIHTVFGTAMHETIQEWLNVMYNDKVKNAMEMDLQELLKCKLKDIYILEKSNNGNNHFTNPQELEKFFDEGVTLLEYLKKKRSDYFSTKQYILVGDEIPLYLQIRPNLYFKGFIDLVLYNEVTGSFFLSDFKTSRSGWSKYVKKDEIKTSQLILYKEFFSKQFDIDLDSIFIKYFILKRQPPYNPDFSTKPIQLFDPPSGKIKRGRVMKLFNSFVDSVFDENGNFVDKDFEKKPSKNNCRFCYVKEEKSVCNMGVF